MDLDSRASHQMAREMRQRVDELESAICLMRTLRDEMEELYSELFGISGQKMECGTTFERSSNYCRSSKRDSSTERLEHLDDLIGFLQEIRERITEQLDDKKA